MKNLVKHMSVDDGPVYGWNMQAGDSSEPKMYFGLLTGLDSEKTLDKIDMLKQEGALYSFNVAAYRQAGYEVRLI